MAVIIDSSIIIAFFNSRDENHEKAMEIMDLVSKGGLGKAYSCDHILDEVVTFVLKRTKEKSRALEVGNWLLESDCEMIYTSKDRFERAWKLFKNSSDLSMTDCTIITTALDEKITNIATFDHEFGQIKKIRVIS